MAWILLVIAGLLEILWAFTMKLSQGFTRPGASIVTLLAMLASFGLLSASIERFRWVLLTPRGRVFVLSGPLSSGLQKEDAREALH